jgi:hypothetical protein
MFSTTDEEVFFVDPEDAAVIENQLSNLGIKPYQRFRIMRRVIGTGRKAESSFVVAPIQSQNGTGAGSQPTPDHAHRPSPPVQGASSQSQGTSTNGKRPARDLIAECFEIAVDSLVAQQEYARQQGLMLRVGQRDVISVAMSLFINAGRGGAL